MPVEGPDRFGAALQEGRRADLFLDAMAAGAAVVATADGHVDREERRALLADASSHPDLLGMPQRVLERFDEYVARMKKDPTRGSREAFMSVASFATDPVRARKLLDVFTDIAGGARANAATRGAVEDLRIVLNLPR
jgi:tellurite resistance protein